VRTRLGNERVGSSELASCDQCKVPSDVMSNHARVVELPEVPSQESASFGIHGNSARTRKTSNSLIVVSAILTLILVLLFLELHIRRLLLHSSARGAVCDLAIHNGFGDARPSDEIAEDHWNLARNKLELFLPSAFPSGTCRRLLLAGAPASRQRQ
jgi:hypothetical protein